MWDIVVVVLPFLVTIASMGAVRECMVEVCNFFSTIQLNIQNLVIMYFRNLYLGSGSGNDGGRMYSSGLNSSYLSRGSDVSSFLSCYFVVITLYFLIYFFFAGWWWLFLFIHIPLFWSWFEWQWICWQWWV